MVIVVEPLPPAFVAVIVYVVCGETAVGVPPISPLDVLNARPVGRFGVIAQEVGVPPLYVGVTLPMVVPLVNTDELGL